MDKISSAVHFATDVFEGKKRKCSGEPAILHSFEAAVIVSSMTDEEDVIISAILHDTVEDAGVTFEELEERFGGRVTELVRSETEDKRRGTPPAETWMIRKTESIEFLRKTKDTGVRMLFLGDKLSNMRSIYNDLQREGAAMWKNFNQKDPSQHHWYYRTIADVLSDLKAYPAWQEYDRLIRLSWDE